MTHTHGSLAITEQLPAVYHAPACGGTCDGCGWIADDGLWYPGPTPDGEQEAQAARSEG